MPTPNAGFVQSLLLMDPLLSVRFGDTIQQWVIERKGFIATEEMGYLVKRERRLDQIVHNPKHAQAKSKFTDWQSCHEELISARAGKRVIMITSVLSQQIFNALCQSDIRRYGGYSRMADELEAAEMRMYADQERMRLNSQHAYNLEVADALQYIWRKKEDMLLNGERNMNRLLHGKRSNKPIVEADKQAEPRIQLATH